MIHTQEQQGKRGREFEVGGGREEKDTELYPLKRVFYVKKEHNNDKTTQQLQWLV